PGADRLSGGSGAFVRADGGDSDRRRSLCACARNGAADGMTSYAAEVTPGRRLVSWDFVRRHLLTAYAVLAFVYLLVPIAVVIAFSFNNPAGRFNYTWQGFTFDNWRNWDAVPGLADAMKVSI